MGGRAQLIEFSQIIPGINKLKYNIFSCAGQMLEYSMGKGEMASSFSRGRSGWILGKISALKGGKCCPGQRWSHLPWNCPKE